jgi:hypothetical protein
VEIVQPSAFAIVTSALATLGSASPAITNANTLACLLLSHIEVSILHLRYREKNPSGVAALQTASPEVKSFSRRNQA